MPATKREQILETAERLFYAEGFHATGIDRVTAEAGVVRMTLYNNFASKDALIATVLQRRHARFLAALDAALAASAPGRGTLALVAAHNAWLAEHGAKGCILVKALGEFAAHNPTIAELALAAKAELRTRLRAALHRDGFADADLDDLSDRIFLVLEGSNAAVPVAGVAPVTAQTRAAVADLLDAAVHPNTQAAS